MKKIEAFIRHEAFEPIRMELLDLGFPSLTISEVKGSGRQKGIVETYRGAVLTNYLRPKVKLECVVADKDVQTIVDTVLKHGRTGAVGDGKVFVLAVDEAYRVRTGESGEEVLQAHPDPAATAAKGGGSVNGAAGPQRRPAAPAAPKSPGTALVARLRELHLEMVDAVLHGEGLERVAAIVARAADAPVAIVVPRLGAAALEGTEEERLDELRRYVTDRVRDRPVSVPAGVASEAPIMSGDELVGAVLLLAGKGEPAPESLEYLHLAAVACLTEVAVAEAREEVEENLRGSFIDDLRSRPDLDPADVVRRAARLGCDLSRGIVALCAELSSDRPRHVVATIAGDYPGALAQHLEGSGVPRVHALLPAAGGDGAPEQTLARARALAERLGRRGTVGLSSFYTDPADIGRAIQEAELVLDVLRRSDGAGSEGLQEIGTGTYRLLFRVLASHPEEVRSFYEDTIAPVVRYDDQYRTDLVGTLEAYFAHNCNMNATAAAIFAHRHTVAYRLDRVRELSGLDATQSEDRERLGLGLKAYRIISPRLPR